MPQVSMNLLPLCDGNHRLRPTFLNFFTVSQIPRTSWSDLRTTLSWPNSLCSTGGFASVSGGLGAIVPMPKFNGERLDVHGRKEI